MMREPTQYDGAARMKGQARVEPAYVTFPGYGNRNVIDTVRSANTCGYNADGQLVRGCGVTRVSYSGANVVREHDGDWWYVLGPGLDDPVLVVKRGFVGAPGVTEAWYPVISDGHGDLLALADSAGQLQGTVLTPEYDAGVWNNSGLTGNAHAFNPRRQATPGGIDTISTFRTRQYDPATGKWLQEDQAGVAGGVNLYEYNGNDPNSFSDPFGMEACKDANGKAIDCPEPAEGPPVALPTGPNGEKNIWVKKGQNAQGGSRDKWVPKYSVRSPGSKGGQPDASWDKTQGHWDVNTGQGGPSRKYLPDGTEVDHDNRPVSGSRQQLSSMSTPGSQIVPALVGAAAALWRLVTSAEPVIVVVP